MMLLQQTVPDPRFWPQDASGWVWLIVAVGGVIGAILGFVYKVYIKPIKDEIAAERKARGEQYATMARESEMNGLGMRVKDVEEACAKREGATDQLERQQQTFEFAVAALAKDMGDLKATLNKDAEHITKSIDGVRDMVGKTHSAVEQDARRWERKFARIEGKIGIPTDPVTGD